MKLLYITPSLGAGGAERQASILLPGLRRLGVDARALALDAGGPFVEPLRAAGVPVEVTAMRHRFDWGPLWRSPLVRRFEPDVIVSRGVSGAYVGQALARRHRAAHVFNDHRGVGVELSQRRVRMLGALARRLDGVIVVSEDQRQGWLNAGCPPERVLVIPNGVEIPSSSDGAAQIRGELGIPDSAVVALIVASLRPVKRVPDFVRAVLDARRERTDLVGVIVGDGSEREAVEREAGGDPAIRLLGHRDDVPALLQAADLLALTSEHEAMPMAILEGMAAGLPVIATRVGGIGNVVVDGETGVLVPPGDAAALTRELARLAGDPELRRAMGQAGRARCREHWDAERMTAEYHRVLSDAASRRSRGHRRPGPASLIARSFLNWTDRRGWVTWEREADDATVLMVVNIWPEPDAPTRAPFLRGSVDGLQAAGVGPDVLYVRGYRGVHCYLLGCLALALLPVARPGQYRLVHSQAGETAIPARCFWAAPVLATYWGSDILGPREGGLATRIRFAGGSRLLRRLALLMAATTTKTAEMESVLPRRARARNRVIPDGIDPGRFAPVDRAQARATLGWPQDEPTVITVGRRSPVKRLWLAEEAAGLAARELPGLRWRAVADVTPADMPLYYGAADLLLHTSASEGSPNVIKEAMACALPVLATAAGDIPQLLAGVEPSAVCEARPEALAREIVRIVREGRRSNGREYIGEMTVEVATARTLELYRSLGVKTPR